MIGRRHYAERVELVFRVHNWLGLPVQRATFPKTLNYREVSCGPKAVLLIPAVPVPRAGASLCSIRRLDAPHFGNRLITDPDMIEWNPDRRSFPDPLRNWVERGRRGIVWSVDRGLDWEMVCSDLGDP